MNTKQLYFSAVLVLSAVICSVSFAGCHNVEKGTGQVLDNAGSAIRHESAKLWIPKDEANDSVEGAINDGAENDESVQVVEEKNEEEVKDPRRF